MCTLCCSPRKFAFVSRGKVPDLPCCENRNSSSALGGPTTCQPVTTYRRRRRSQTSIARYANTLRTCTSRRKRQAVSVRSCLRPGCNRNGIKIEPTHWIHCGSHDSRAVPAILGDTSVRSHSSIRLSGEFDTFPKSGRTNCRTNAHSRARWETAWLGPARESGRADRTQ